MKRSESQKKLSQPGFEPGTFGLEIQRAIHCATRTTSYEHTLLLYFSKIGQEKKSKVNIGYELRVQYGSVV